MYRSRLGVYIETSLLHSSVFGTGKYSIYHRETNEDINLAITPLIYNGILHAKYDMRMVTQRLWEGVTNQYLI